MERGHPSGWPLLCWCYADCRGAEILWGRAGWLGCAREHSSNFKKKFLVDRAGSWTCQSKAVVGLGLRMICLDSAAVLTTYLRGGQQRGLLYAGLMTWGAGFACDLAGTRRCLAGWLAAGGLFIWLAAVETFLSFDLRGVNEKIQQNQILDYCYRD